MDVKNIIKNRRSELNLTMKEVATIVGVSEGTVSRWESGDIANMKRDKIAALANALNLSPAIIMGWEEHPKVETGHLSLTPEESALLDNFQKLNHIGQNKALDYVSDLAEQEKYTKEATSQKMA